MSRERNTNWRFWRSAERNPIKRESEKMGEGNVVRVLPLSLARPYDVFGEENLDFDNLWFTRSYWLLKSNKAANPNQIMLPGGNRKRRTLENGEEVIEDPVKAARREISEELGIDVMVIHEGLEISHREYTFIHGKTKQPRRNNEMVYEGRVPHFITPVSFDPRDNTQSTLSLTPENVEALLIHESIEVNGSERYLLDSLCSATLQSETQPYRRLQAEQQKDRLILQSYSYEIEMKIKVLSRLLANRNLQQGRLETLSQQPVNSIDQARILSNHLNNYLQGIAGSYKGVSHKPGEPMKIADQFLKDLKLAYEEVYFVESLQYVREAGLQTSYLVGQIIVDLSRFTKYELEALAEADPKLYKFYNVVAEAFRVDIQEDNWYEQLCLALQTYKSFKVRHNTLSPIERNLFERQKKRLERFFSKELLGERNSQMFTQHAQNANRFFQYMQEPYVGVVPASILEKMGFDPKYTATTQLDELILVAFGYSQYGGEDTVDKEMSWQALKKLINIIDDVDDMKEYANLVERGAYPVRAAFADITTTHVRGGTVADTYPSNHTKLQTDKIIVLPATRRIPVPLTETVVLKEEDLDYRIRDKSVDSVKRKRLERPEPEIKDPFGYEMIFNPSPSIKKRPESLRAYSREAIGHTVERLLGYLVAHGYSLELSNIKEKGMLNGLLKETLLHMSSVLTQEKLDSQVSVQWEHTGSGASDVTWSWLKFSLTINGTSCEVQLYPTHEDYVVKKRDDPAFAKKRNLISHDPGKRFPVADVLYRSEVVYNLFKAATYSGMNE